MHFLKLCTNFLFGNKLLVTYLWWIYSYVNQLANYIAPFIIFARLSLLLFICLNVFHWFILLCYCFRFGQWKTLSFVTKRCVCVFLSTYSMSTRRIYCISKSLKPMLQHQRATSKRTNEDIRRLKFSSSLVKLRLLRTLYTSFP